MDISCTIRIKQLSPVSEIGRSTPFQICILIFHPYITKIIYDFSVLVVQLAIHPSEYSYNQMHVYDTALFLHACYISTELLKALLKYIIACGVNTLCA
jgi:hypothetical protein